MKRLSRAERKEQKERLAKQSRSFKDYPILSAIKPREKYVFHSDYFTMDGRYATIMSFFHVDGATDNFGAFWGVNRIPSGLDKDVQVVLFEQTRKMTEEWTSSHQSNAEGVSEMNANEQGRAGSNTSIGKANRRNEDLRVIAQELQDGAAYLHVTFRLMVSASTLDKLDDAVDKISRLYIDRFATAHAAPYIGDQRRELSTLFSKNDKKLGKGYYFTSTEYAGAYSLVTHGLEDPDGEYVGYMVGDVNNAAVLFAVNNYGHHTVVADENFADQVHRTHVTSYWGSKLSQACLLKNGRCVHLILDGTNLDELGPAFDRLTFKLDLNHGDVNMFEIFGDRKDQLALFPAQMQKLILMAEQAYEPTDSDRSIIRGSLEEVATKYYIDQRMWYDNAGQNQDKLRIVGIPHSEVPKLEMFCSYLDMEYKALVHATAKDEAKLQAMSVLSITFKNLLSNNGDLFNTTTSDAIDGARTGRRVIYDFSGLMLRGVGVAMAQLVNIMGFAVNSLGYGDTVFVHGADRIDDGVKSYIQLQFQRLYEAGGRVVFLYNDMDRMLADKEFCAFDKADYTILGTMTQPTLNRYQEMIGQRIPADLAKLVCTRNSGASYIRRGYDNVVFHRELSLGLKEGSGAV